MSVIEPNPSKKMISAHRSRRAEACLERIEENESNALIMKRTLSIARNLSIKYFANPGVELLTMLMTMTQTPTMVAEFGRM